MNPVRAGQSRPVDELQTAVSAAALENRRSGGFALLSRQLDLSLPANHASHRLESIAVEQEAAPDVDRLDTAVVGVVLGLAREALESAWAVALA